MVFDVCLGSHFDMNVVLKEGENAVAGDQPKQEAGGGCSFWVLIGF